MKKIILFCFLCLINFYVFSAPQDSVKELRLENGLTVFILEDTSSPFIRIEYTTKAGFSSQTQNTSGFFKLYTQIFSSTLNQLDFELAECLADSSRYVTNITPSKLINTLELLSKQAFSPNFTDEQILKNLKLLQKQVQENATSTGTLINAAIDSKVFSASPWKHDSGLYAPVFSKTTLQQARTILLSISEHWYTPQNSALLISGNFNSQKLISLIEQTFGSYYSSYKTPSQKKEEAKNFHKKFVIHDSELSDEMTQIVVQYTNFNSMEECDLASAILNNDSSFFKFNLLNQKDLNIPGNEYINVQSATKKDSNRLIIQSLLLPPQDKNLLKKTNVVSQTKNFTKQIQNGFEYITNQEFMAFQNQLVFDMAFMSSSSSVFMDKLSSWWAIEQYSSSEESILENNSITVQNLLNRKNRLKSCNLNSILNSLNNNTPYIFVIISTKEFNKYKNEFTKEGFQEISKNNSSWYTQKLYEQIKTQNSNVQAQKTQNTNQPTLENDYYTKNINQINNTKLLNGINVTSKHNPNSSQISLLISIRGGKLNSSKDNGFEEVMISLLTTNIQKEIYEQAQKGKILGLPSVDYTMQHSTSYIVLECEKEDFEQCCLCISNALIYGEIIPAIADRAVANKQYQKRLENGTSNYQLYSALINHLYPKSDLSKIYNSKDDVLTNITYLQILQEYPKLLDSSRYNLIIAGNFNNDYITTLNNSIGLLANQNGKINTSSNKTSLPKNKELKVKVNHTFLTDIPKEKAGPMPAVLIPTTEFLDPVLYVFECPKKQDKTRAIFDATLFYIQEKLNQKLADNKKLSKAKANVNLSPSCMDASVLSVSNVKSPKELDAVLKIVIEELNQQIKSSSANKIIEEIKEQWIINVLQDSNTNTKTVELLQQGFEYFPLEQKPSLYLEEYNTITNLELSQLMDVLEYFPSRPQLRVYSSSNAN